MSGTNVAGSPLVNWPQYNASSGIYLNFGNGTADNTDVATTVEPFGTLCTQLWDRLVPQLTFQPYTIA